MIKIFFLKFVYVLLVLTTFLRVEPKGSILNLKNMTENLSFLDANQDYKISEQLSPSMGALFWELPFIYNIYVYGNDDAMHKLIKELFNVQTDGSLSTTHSYTKIARYFTSEIIADIIGNIFVTSATVAQEIQKKQSGQAIKEIINSTHIKDKISALVKGFVDEYTNKDLGLEKKHIVPSQLPLEAASTLPEPEPATIKEIVIDGITKNKNRLAGERASIEKKIAELSVQHKPDSILEFFAKKDNFKQAAAACRSLPETLSTEHKNALTSYIQELEIHAERISSVKSLDNLAQTKKIYSKIAFPKLLLQEKTAASHSISPELIARFKELKKQADILSETNFSEGDIAILRKLVDTTKILLVEKIKLEKRINDRENELKNEASNAKAIELQEFKESVTNFCELITNAFELEFSDAYPNGIVIDLLLGFLWNKFNAVEMFDRYMLQLAKLLSPTTENFIPVHDIFTKEEYMKFKTMNPDALNFDQLVYVALGYNLFENILPPHVKMLNTVWYRNLNFPDCGETSLRNLINALVYNPDGMFDQNSLTKLGAVKSVIEYYKKYNSPSALSLDEAASHNDWAVVVSNLPGVTYSNQQVCDIDEGITNMFKVLTNLFPDITSFKALAEKVNKELNIKIDITSTGPIEGPSIKEIDNDVSITITKNEYKPFTLVWQFQKGHFELKFPHVAVSPFANTYSLFFKDLHNPTKSQVYLNLYLKSENSTQNLSFFKNAYSRLYFMPLFTNKQKIEAATYITQELKTSQIVELGRSGHKFFMDFIIKLNEKLSRNADVVGKFIKAIANVDQGVENDLIKSQKDSAGLLSSAETIIKNKKTELYDWLAKSGSLTKIVGNDAVELIDLILTMEDGQDVAAEKLSKKLYDWKPNLQNIDSDEILDIITAIFGGPHNPPAARQKFVDTILKSVNTELKLETITSDYASELLVDMSRVPLTSDQEKTVLGAKIISQLVPNLIRKLDTWAKILIKMNTDRYGGNFLGSTILANLSTILHSFDVGENIVKLDNPNVLKLVEYLLKYSNFYMDEKFPQSYVFEILKQKMPDLINTLKEDDLARLVVQLLKHPLTTHQEASWLGAIIKDKIPQLIPQLGGAAWYPMLYLLENPPTQEQEKGWLLTPLLAGLPDLFEKLPVGGRFAVTHALLTSPIKAEHEKLNSLDLIIKIVLKNIYQDDKLSNTVIDVISKSDFDEKIKDTDFGRELLGMMPHLVARSDLPTLSYAAINLADVEPSAISSSLFLSSLDAEIQKLDIPSIIAKSDGKALVMTAIELVGAKSEKVDNSAQLAVINNRIKQTDIAGAMATLSPEEVYDVLAVLIQKPLTDEQEQTYFGNLILTALEGVLSNLQNSLSQYGGAKAYILYNLIFILLANHPTVNVENLRFFKIFESKLPVLLDEIYWSVDATDLFKHLAKYPLSKQQEESQYGQILVKWALSFLPMYLQSAYKPYDFIANNLLNITLTKEQEELQFVKQYREIVLNMIEKCNSSACAAILLKSLLENPGTRDNDSSDYGKKIIDFIPVLLNKLEYDAREELMNNSNLGSAILKLLPKLASNSAINSDVATTIITLLWRYAPTLEQEPELNREIIKIIPELMGRITGGIASLIIALIRNWPSDEQQNLPIIQEIIKDVTTLVDKTTVKETGLGVINNLIKNPLTLEQEQNLVGKFVNHIAHILINKMDNRGQINYLLEQISKQTSTPLFDTIKQLLSERSEFLDKESQTYY